MSTLLDLGVEITEMEDTIDYLLEENGGEITPEIENMMDDLVTRSFDVDNKVDSYGYVLEREKKEQEILSERIAALTRKKRASENKVKGLKERLRLFMLMRDEKKIEGDLFTFARTANGGKTPLIIDAGVDPTGLPSIFTCTTVEVNSNAVREFLDSGELEWARLGERGEHLRVR